MNQNQSIATITFDSEQTTTKSGVKNGKPWEITEQEGTIETPFMRNPCRVSIRKDQAPYARGTYTFDPLRALRVSDFGSVQLARDLQLTPVEAVKLAKSA